MRARRSVVLVLHGIPTAHHPRPVEVRARLLTAKQREAGEVRARRSAVLVFRRERLAC